MKVILLVGLPGSGKSTYAARERLPVLSSDELRHLLLDEVTDQTANRQVFATLRYLLRTRLQLHRAVTCIDATNLTRHERRQYIRTAQLYGAEAEAVFFDVPLAVCKERNLARARNVPDDIMIRMAGRLAPPSLAEGFTRILVVRATDVAPAPSPLPATASDLQRR